MKINRIKAWLNWSFQPKMNYNCESMRIVIRFSLEPNHQSANAMGDIVTVFGISLGEQRNHLWMNYAELKVIVAQFTSGEGGPSRTHSVAESREKSARLEDTNAIAIVITYSRACDYLVRTLITVKKDCNSSRSFLFLPLSSSAVQNNAKSPAQNDASRIRVEWIKIIAKAMPGWTQQKIRSWSQSRVFLAQSLPSIIQASESEQNGQIDEMSNRWANSVNDRPALYC